MSAFRIASFSLILLATLFGWIQMATSGPGNLAKNDLPFDGPNYGTTLAPGPHVGLDWSRLPDGYGQVEKSKPSSFRTAQFLKEVSEQEHKIAEFIHAARVGDKTKVETFLQQGMDINAKNKSGNTALMEACAAGEQEVIVLLLDHKADPDAKNNIGETAARKALKNGQYAVVDLLFSKKAAKASGELLRDVIFYADLHFIEEVFRHLKEADRKAILDALHLACLSGKVEVVQFFLDQGADPNQHKGRPLCHCSGGTGTPVEAVKLLLEKGADVNSYEKTPALINACEGNRPDVVSLLLERGARIDERGEKGETALMVAVKHGGPSMDRVVKILVDKGADVNAKDKTGTPLLAFASREGRVQAARLILDKGADVNVKGEHGLAPLHWAAGTGSVEMVELLLKRGANVNARTDKGATPLRIAAARGHKRVEAVLKTHGAKH